MGEKKRIAYLSAEEMIKNMRLMDDRFMTLVFDGNKEAVELVLNIILEREDLKVSSVTVQKEEKIRIRTGAVSFLIFTPLIRSERYMT